MKKYLHLTLFCGIIATASLTSLAQSNVVFYGAVSNALNVAFADTNLSASAKTGITADLNRCLAGWSAGAQLRTRYKANSVGYLDIASVSPHYPEQMEFPREVVSNVVDGLALYVPKALSDAYTNAFAFAAANSNIVAAAHEFVNFVTSTNFPSMPYAIMPNYIMFKNARGDAVAESNAVVNLAPQIMEDIMDASYHRPSILGFYFSSDGPGETNLWMLVPTSMPRGTTPKDWRALTALWHGGRWRFCEWGDWIP